MSAVLWAALSGMSEQVGPAQELLAPVLALAGNVPEWLYGLIIAGGASLLWQKFRGCDQGGLAAFRSGERR